MESPASTGVSLKNILFGLKTALLPCALKLGVYWVDRNRSHYKRESPPFYGFYTVRAMLTLQ